MSKRTGSGRPRDDETTSSVGGRRRGRGGRRRRDRGRARPRAQGTRGPEREGEPAGDRAEGQRHRQDPAADPDQDQRGREREDPQARGRRGSVGREGRVPGRPGPRALSGGRRERGGEREVGAGQRHAHPAEHGSGPEGVRAVEGPDGEGAGVAVGLRHQADHLPGRVGALQVRPRAGGAGAGRAQAGPGRPVQDHDLRAHGGHGERVEQGGGRDRPRIPVPGGRHPGDRGSLGDGSAGQRGRE